MAKSRISLHEKLVEIIKKYRNEEEWEILEEKRNLPCYFDPPTGMQLTYPCIVYHMTSSFDERADNIRYRYLNQYEMQVIDYDPDSHIADEIVDAFTYCSKGRVFVVDNLSHFNLILYY